MGEEGEGGGLEWLSDGGGEKGGECDGVDV